MSSAEAAVAPDAVLDALEAEAIWALRETAAAFRNPVMLYSIGKDSGVMLHLAAKAFAPGPIPFPVLHVDTTWKFREMIDVPRPRWSRSTASTCAWRPTPRRSPRASRRSATARRSTRG